MASRRTLKIVIVAVTLLGTAALYRHFFAAPACDSEETLGKVQNFLRDELHLTGIFFNNVHNSSGGYLSSIRECSTQITEIRGNITAAEMPWRDLRFWIERGDKPDGAVVSLMVGDSVPLEGPHRSLWERLLAHL